MAPEELLCLAALRQIGREVAVAKDKGHWVFVICDLTFSKLRPSGKLLRELDGSFKAARVPGFNYSISMIRETFAIVNAWGLVRRTGLFSR